MGQKECKKTETGSKARVLMEQLGDSFPFLAAKGGSYRELQPLPFLFSEIAELCSSSAFSDCIWCKGEG